MQNNYEMFLCLWDISIFVMVAKGKLFALLIANFVNDLVNTFHSANKNLDQKLYDLHSMSLLAEKENNESYTFGQMLKNKYAADFIHAMIKEADDNEKRNHWEVVHRWDKPPGVKTILSIWDFRCKCFPDGRIIKHRAQLCAHGGMQQYGLNYWETYSPTVNWISVQFLMIVAKNLKLDKKQLILCLILLNLTLM